MKKLLLLHGALGAPVQFEPLKALLSNEFELISPAFAGHGGGSVPPELNMNLLVSQLQNLIEAQHLQGIPVFGYSMGGYAALCLAAQKPDYFLKIFTLGTKMNWTPEGAEKESKMLNPDGIKAKVPQYGEYLEKLHGDGWPELCNATANFMLGLGAHNLLNDAVLATINTPVIIGLGDADKMVSREETMNAAAQIPGAGLCILPHTQHPLEKVSPTLLAGMIRLLLA